MDKIRLSIINKKNRPTMSDLVKPKLDRKSKLVFRVALEKSKKDQAEVLKKAARIN